MGFQLLSSAGSAEPSQASSSSRPSIIFVFVDDQRYDTLGVAGHPIVKTPNLATDPAYAKMLTVMRVRNAALRESYLMH